MGMPAAFLGAMCSGHACFPPRPNGQASPNVYVEGIPFHRQGDYWHVHCCTCSRKKHGCHSSSLAGGSSTVFVDCRGAGRLGDAVACGSVCVQGVSSVIVG